MKVGDVDLTNPGSFAQAVPHDYFAFLRKEAPVSWNPRPAEMGGGGFWNIVRYNDIMDVEKNVEVFTNKTNISPLPIPESTLESTIDRSIILSDPPRHTFLRRAITGAFTPRAIKTLEENIAQYAVNAIDAVIEKGHCDWHDVAAYTPIEVVADILGVPSYDRQKLYNWANAMFGAGDPELSDPMRNMMGALQMLSYAQKTGLDRRENPQDDVFSIIANAEEDGERLSLLDMGATFIVLATAGNETTRTQFMQGTLNLIEHPEAMTALREDLSLLPNALEEMLRFTTPALGFGRKATRDIEMHGQMIKAGDQVMMWYCSGNRDESVFENPDVFDIYRKNAKAHMAFGSQGGIHRCLGSMLARSELRAMFTQLLTRIPDIQLDGPVDRLISNFTNGIKRMPVRFTPGKAIGDASSVPMYASHSEPKPMPAPQSTDANVLSAKDGHDIKLVHLCTATLDIGIPTVMENGPRGTRMIVEVTGATWEGEHLNAKQVGGPAGDWALLDKDGSLQIDVRCHLQTEDGASIYVSYQGRSDYMQAGQAPIITAPTFETNDHRYAWLNKVQAIGRGRAAGMNKLIYEIYAVQ
ncbi:MAG: cytochrome [Cellvibrionaceae bacterium]|nr:cytochrome [Cellvibrionaceae bacterium]|tara:strand:- start:33018 stop:34766 length:1749 start_codon:yes stop_codon:yes gene_type:complete